MTTADKLSGDLIFALGDIVIRFVISAIIGKINDALAHVLHSIDSLFNGLKMRTCPLAYFLTNASLCKAH